MLIIVIHFCFTMNCSYKLYFNNSYYGVSISNGTNFVLFSWNSGCGIVSDLLISVLILLCKLRALEIKGRNLFIQDLEERERQSGIPSPKIVFCVVQKRHNRRVRDLNTNKVLEKEQPVKPSGDLIGNPLPGRRWMTIFVHALRIDMKICGFCCLLLNFNCNLICAQIVQIYIIGPSVSSELFTLRMIKNRP